MSEKLFSVIMPSFKMGQYVGEALESVGAQTYPHWEVIVVDDAGPEDGTRAAVEAFAGKHPGHRVEYMRLRENRGVSAARNAGASAAKGELFAFLDPDDLWKADHLTRHVGARKGQIAPMVTASRLAVFRGADPAAIVCERGFTDWEQKTFPMSLALWNAIPPSCVVADRNCFAAVGGFDEDRLLQHSEDWDLWLRLVDAGADFRLINEVTVLYRQHEGGATADRAMMRRRAEVFARKHADSLQLKLSLLTHMLGERIDGLEARLNYLQSNPIVRLISGLGGLLGRKREGKR